MRRLAFCFTLLICLAPSINGPRASASTVPACPGGAGTYPDDCPRFGQPGNYLADNASHRVDLQDTLESTGSAAQWVLNEQFPSLDFTWRWVDSADYDVRIIDDYFPGAHWYGKSFCTENASYGGSTPNRWCSKKKLQLNLSLVGAWNTTRGRRTLLCHELGHSVGLNHPDGGYVASSCLENERVPDQGESTSYDTVDRTNVKEAY